MPKGCQGVVATSGEIQCSSQLIRLRDRNTAAARFGTCLLNWSDWRAVLTKEARLDPSGYAGKFRCRATCLIGTEKTRAAWPMVLRKAALTTVNSVAFAIIHYSRSSKFGELERCCVRLGNARSLADLRRVPEPVVACYRFRMQR